MKNIFKEDLSMDELKKMVAKLQHSPIQRKKSNRGWIMFLVLGVFAVVAVGAVVAYKLLFQCDCDHDDEDDYDSYDEDDEDDCFYTDEDDFE